MLHQRLDLFCSDGYVLHQVDMPGFGDPDIILDTDSHLFFFDIDTRLHGKEHSRLYRFSTGSQVMHIQAKMM